LTRISLKKRKKRNERETGITDSKGQSANSFWEKGQSAPKNQEEERRRRAAREATKKSAIGGGRRKK